MDEYGKGRSGMILSTRQRPYIYVGSPEIQELEETLEELSDERRNCLTQTMNSEARERPKEREEQRILRILTHPCAKWVHKDAPVMYALNSIGVKRMLDILDVYTGSGGRLPKKVVLMENLPDIPVPGNYAD